MMIIGNSNASCFEPGQTNSVQAFTIYIIVCEFALHGPGKIEVQEQKSWSVMPYLVCHDDNW